MIHKASIVLVVDANILLSIASDQETKSLIGALHAWVSGLVNKAHPAPRGKTVTVLATRCILRGYRTGLCRGGCPVNQGTKKAFHSYTGKSMPVDRSSNIKFSVKVVQERADLGRIDVGDKYDLPYPRLLLTMASEQKWSDRRVIFATKDARLLSSVRDLMVRRVHSERFHFAATREDFEEAIMC